MDAILLFDDSPPPTDDILGMMTDNTLKDLIGLNDSMILDLENATAVDMLLEDYTEVSSEVINSELSKIYQKLNQTQLTPYPILGKLGYKETTMFEFVTVGIMLTAVSIFGLAGNIVAIVVLSSPVMKGSFSSLLIGKCTCTTLS